MRCGKELRRFLGIENNDERATGHPNIIIRKSKSQLKARRRGRRQARAQRGRGIPQNGARGLDGRLEMAQTRQCSRVAQSEEAQRGVGTKGPHFAVHGAGKELAYRRSASRQGPGSDCCNGVAFAGVGQLGAQLPLPRTVKNAVQALLPFGQRSGAAGVVSLGALQQAHGAPILHLQLQARFFRQRQGAHVIAYICRPEVGTHVLVLEQLQLAFAEHSPDSLSFLDRQPAAHVVGINELLQVERVGVPHAQFFRAGTPNHPSSHRPVNETPNCALMRVLCCGQHHIVLFFR